MLIVDNAGFKIFVTVNKP